MPEATPSGASPESPGARAAPVPGGLRRLLSNHNPLYPVSAALVLHGLHTSLQAGDAGLGTAGTIVVLCGYTLLLALAAVLVVQLARVWEDARTIICVFVLLNLALSALFDDFLQTDRVRGTGMLFAVLGIVMLSSEVLLRGAGLRLGLLYRLPYHAIITVVTLYPALLARLVETFDPTNPVPLSVALAAFPVLAGGAFLLLVPALRRGASYLAGNGTPWSWPWVPLPVFALLGAGVVARTYMLGYSLYPATGGGTPFALWQFAPYPLVLAVLLLETASALPGARRARLHALALLLPLMTLALALPPQYLHPTKLEFLRAIASNVGAPSCLAWTAVAAFFVYAWRRGLPRAEDGLTLALLYGACVGSHAVTRADMAIDPLPLLAICLLQGALFVRRCTTARALWTLLAAVASCTTWLADSWTASGSGVVAAHLVCGGLAIGGWFRDELARVLRDLATIGLLGLFLTAAILDRALFPSASPVLVQLHVGLLVGVTAAALWWLRTPLLRVVLCLQLTILVLQGVARLPWAEFWRRLPAGALSVIFGVVTLAAGLLVSLAKGGALRWPGRRAATPGSDAPG